MTTVQIGSEREGLRLVTEPAGESDYVLVELRSDGLTATRWVFDVDAGFHSLAECFGTMAADWRGWDGERAWESSEGDLRIVARHEHGHVQLRIVVSSWEGGQGGRNWTATADLRLDPGEELSRVAAELADLAHGSG